MKDVPTELPEGLVHRGDAARASTRATRSCRGAGYTLDTLPQGAQVGTSSLRRIAQVRALRPDVEIVDVRGNLDTRMRKAENGEVDVVILAAAGITRMGWADRITHYIPTEQMVSAVGQGAIGIEIREDDEFMRDVMRRRSATPTRCTCVTAERVVMRTLEGGCQVPIGAYARIDGDADRTWTPSWAASTARRSCATRSTAMPPSRRCSARRWSTGCSTWAPARSSPRSVRRPRPTSAWTSSSRPDPSDSPRGAPSISDAPLGM